MSSLAVANMLASVLVPIGNAGAVLAVVCALIFALAFARGSAGLAGGAAGVWILGALLSLCASFATVWTPVVVSLSALAAAFVVGVLGRVLLRAARRPRAASAAAAAPADAVPGTAKPAAARITGRSAPARTGAETVRVAS